MAPSKTATAPQPQPAYLGLPAATLLVIANMVGTGVFTTLGLQAAGVPDGAALLLVWLLGGVVAFAGALCYAELAAALPRSGGEYHFLTTIYGPRLGEVAGWVSVVIGFAAPMALAAMAFGRYVATVVPVPELVLGLGAVALVSAVHAIDRDLGRHFQVAATVLKVVLILVLGVAGLLAPAVPGALTVTPGAGTLAAVLSAPFAVSVIYVSYAYSGWNAATYVTAEIDHPQRRVPLALLLGTGIVTALYLLLNLVFLRTIPAPALAGTVEVGALSAQHIFGTAGGELMSLALGLLLISTISAMALAGPRVIEVMAVDRPSLRLLSARTARGAPLRATVALWLLATGFVLTDSFAAVLGLAGFTLILFALLTVLGVMRLRRRRPDLPRPFRVPLYPAPPVLFALIAVASLGVVAATEPVAVLAGLALLSALWLVVGVAQRRRTAGSSPRP